MTLACLKCAAVHRTVRTAYTQFVQVFSIKSKRFHQTHKHKKFGAQNALLVELKGYAQPTLLHRMDTKQQRESPGNCRKAVLQIVLGQSGRLQKGSDSGEEADRQTQGRVRILMEYKGMSRKEEGDHLIRTTNVLDLYQCTAVSTFHTACSPAYFTARP